MGGHLPCVHRLAHSISSRTKKKQGFGGGYLASLSHGQVSLGVTALYIGTDTQTQQSVAEELRLWVPTPPTSPTFRKRCLPSLPCRQILELRQVHRPHRQPLSPQILLGHLIGQAYLALQVSQRQVAV